MKSKPTPTEIRYLFLYWLIFNQTHLYGNNKWKKISLWECVCVYIYIYIRYNALSKSYSKEEVYFLFSSLSLWELVQFSESVWGEKWIFVISLEIMVMINKMIKVQAILARARNCTIVTLAIRYNNSKRKIYWINIWLWIMLYM